MLQQLHTPSLVLKDYALVRRTTSQHPFPVAHVCSHTSDDALPHALPPRGGFAEALYQEAEALVRALAANRVVREIEISAPLCVDQGGVRLLQAIAAANAAVKLALTLKTLSYPAMTVLSDYIAGERCRLVELNLESTHVGDQGVVLLSNALQGNRTLKLLSLRKCQFGATGARALAAALRHSHTASAKGLGCVLEDLDISWNQIPPVGIESVMLALSGVTSSPNSHKNLLALGAESTGAGEGEPNTLLTNLDVSWNRIGGNNKLNPPNGGERDREVGINALALCLMRNSSLVRLDLRNTCLDDVEREAAVLAAALKVNAHLRVLRLEGNRVGMSAVMLRALMHCAPVLSFGVEAGEAFANSAQMHASLLPIRSLKDNPSGHYRLDLGNESQRRLAVWILDRVVTQGNDTCRNEALNGEALRLQDLLQYVAQLAHAPKLRLSGAKDEEEEQVLELDFLAPETRRNEWLTETKLQSAASAISRAQVCVSFLN